MNGNESKGIVLQSRDRHLLEELATMRVFDREQARRVGGFGSVTRVNVRLLALTRAGMLRRFFIGTTAVGQKALYSLAPKGAGLVGVPVRGVRHRRDAVLTADFFVQHQLAVNEIYCAVKYERPPVVGFHRWIAFQEPFKANLRLIPDGYFELQTGEMVLAAFLEVDRGTETLRVWSEKVRNYLQLALSGDYEKRFEQNRFRIFVIADSAKRLQSIRKTVAEITQKIFWFALLAEIQEKGFFEAQWLRPDGSSQTLINQTP
jgi:Replication-relaxation